MFISFLIPSVFEGVRARHLCVFYAQLAAFGRSSVGFVGEPAYFEAPAALEAAGRPEWLPSWRAAYAYEPPADLAGVTCEPLPAHLFAARLRRLGSSWKLYGQLVTKRLPELETAFDAALDAIAARRPVEAVLVFADNPSVSAVARRRGVPVVHNEFGPLRPPDYVMTAYWDQRGISRHSDTASRYRAFRRESIAARVPLLERAEILEVLRRTPLPEGPGPAQAPFRVGIALQGDENAYVQGTSALDLLSMARQYYRAGEILVRYHPACATRYPETLAVTDDSPTATAFIQQCETVLTVSSGTAFEAMLLGRRAVVTGRSPWGLGAATHLGGRERRSAGEARRRLNFLAFGCLVPGALMFDADYVRWRLTGPSELDIYRHHQRWYRRNLLAQPVPACPAVALAAGAKLLDAVPNGRAPQATVVFGAGAVTPSVVAQLRSERFTLEAVFDNDRARWGTLVAGLPVERPRFRAGTTVVVPSLTHGDAIVRQLSVLGYSADHILRLR